MPFLYPKAGIDYTSQVTGHAYAPFFSPFPSDTGYQLSVDILMPQDDSHPLILLLFGCSSNPLNLLIALLREIPLPSSVLGKLQFRQSHQRAMTQSFYAPRLSRMPSERVVSQRTYTKQKRSHFFAGSVVLEIPFLTASLFSRSQAFKSTPIKTEFSRW